MCVCAHQIYMYLTIPLMPPMHKAPFLGSHHSRKASLYHNTCTHRIIHAHAYASRHTHTHACTHNTHDTLSTTIHKTCLYQIRLSMLTLALYLHIFLPKIRPPVHSACSMRISSAHSGGPSTAQEHRLQRTFEAISLRLSLE